MMEAGTLILPDFIEVEIGTFCNRHCSWCPNSVSDRGSTRNTIADATWLKLIENLRDLTYAGWIGLHNFNEPLADPTVLSKIQDVKLSVGSCRLALYTNGDLLSRAVLNSLVMLETNEIRVTLYPAESRMHLDDGQRRIQQFLSRIHQNTTGAALEVTHRGLEMRFSLSNTVIHIIAPRISAYNNRGGLITRAHVMQTDTRHEQCLLPFTSAAIDYEGNLKLCCQIFDAKDSAPINIIGNIREHRLEELWMSAKMNAVRKLTFEADFDLLPNCKRCSYHMRPAQHELATLRAEQVFARSARAVQEAT